MSVITEGAAKLLGIPELRPGQLFKAAEKNVQRLMQWYEKQGLASKGSIMMVGGLVAEGVGHGMGYAAEHSKIDQKEIAQESSVVVEEYQQVLQQLTPEIATEAINTYKTIHPAESSLKIPSKSLENPNVQGALLQLGVESMRQDILPVLQQTGAYLAIIRHADQNLQSTDIDILTTLREQANQHIESNGYKKPERLKLRAVDFLSAERLIAVAQSRTHVALLPTHFFSKIEKGRADGKRKASAETAALTITTIADLLRQSTNVDVNPHNERVSDALDILRKNKVINSRRGASDEIMKQALASGKEYLLQHMTTITTDTPYSSQGIGLILLDDVLRATLVKLDGHEQLKQAGEREKVSEIAALLSQKS